MAAASHRRHRGGRRVALAALVRRSGASRLLRRLPTWRGVLILNYHRIGDPSGSELHPQLWSATADGLDRQLRQAKDWFDVVAPAELGASLRARAGRRVFVTFDDGYRDLHAEAAPVLRAHGIRAGIFLCSGFIDGTATAWWDEIAWMLHRARLAELPRPLVPRPLALAGAGRRTAIRHRHPGLRGARPGGRRRLPARPRRRDRQRA